MSYKKINGKYRITISYPLSNGKYGRLYATAETLKEAKEKEALMTAQVKGQKPSVATFGALSELYLESCVGKLRTTTIQQYRNSLKHHVLPYFKDSVFIKISIEELRRWRASEIEKGYSLETLSKGKKAINCVVAFAQREYDLTNNAFHKLEPFRRNPDEVEEEGVRFWTLPQFQEFERTIKAELERTDPWSPKYIGLSSTYALCAICFFAGLRRGEANALKVEDYHDNGVHPFLDVKRSVAQKAGKGIGYLVTPPKSKRSVRKVPVPYALESILRDHLRVLARIPGFSPSFWLVGGYKIAPDETINVNFRRLADKADLPPITIHELRHSYATMLYNSGASLAVIAKLMGHTITKVTELYSHTYDETLDNAVALLDGLQNSALHR